MQLEAPGSGVDKPEFSARAVGEEVTERAFDGVSLAARCDEDGQELDFVGADWLVEVVHLP